MINLGKLRARARRLKVEAIALGLALGNPGTPWYAKLAVAGCVLYVVTPVDLLPDFLPILGFVDDMVFVPAALALAASCVPRPVLAQCRARAQEFAAIGIWDLLKRTVIHR